VLGLAALTFLRHYLLPHRVRVWLFSKEGRAASSLLLKLEKLMRGRGFEVAAHSSAPPELRVARMDAAEAKHWADVVVVVGGDGTLLRAFHEVSGALPMLGVNSGSIGFLMEVAPSQVERAVEALAEGDYAVEERMTGVALIGEREYSFVNELVFSSPRHDKLVLISSYVDGALAQRGRADGLIVATPTGSTAYALSAGGPVLDPRLDAFVLVPIAPFSALLKPMVFSSSRRIVVSTNCRCRVVIDGLKSLEVEPCEVEVRGVRGGLKLVKLPFSEGLWNRLRRRLTDTIPSQAML